MNERHADAVASGATVLSGAAFCRDTHHLLRDVVSRLGYERDHHHRYILLAHLFDDTQRMIEALEPFVDFDAIIGVPYSSNRPGLRERWSKRFGDVVKIAQTVDAMETALVKQLAQSLDLCRRNGQKLIVQEVGGFVVPLLHKYFREDLHLVRGVVEITKQGVWRAEAMDLGIPVLHCADSELKRLEAKRCGETIARCLDGIARDLGQSLAGRHATVLGAGWIGSGIASALKRLDMVPSIIDLDPLKLVEARLDGYGASRTGDDLHRASLVVGATGHRSVTPEILERLPDGALVASGSSRQHEIDVPFLKGNPSSRISESVEAFHLVGARGPARSVLLVNDGYPANFIPGSGSVPDEIVETILAELIVLMHSLSLNEFEPGIHRITPDQERFCADLWLDLRDRRGSTGALSDNDTILRTVRIAE